ncbi:MAG: protease modulator HflC [Ottowia sp.]|nr:protease modulator HflC [Ottowia sp.]
MTNKAKILLAVLVVALLALGASLFIVDQRRFGVVYQFGQIQRVISEPGLNAKIPFIQTVVYMDKRLLTLDSQDTEPMLTAEKQRVVIDWYVRWRITDPQYYIPNLGGATPAVGAMQLNRVVRNAFQEEINRRTVSQLLSSQRDELMADVKAKVLAAVRGEKPWGMDISDVRITRIDYAESITEDVYRRMQAERERVARELRATGAAEAERIRAEADRQREVIVAHAQRDAEKLRGEGDAAATRIYAEAFGKDEQFAAFWRSLNAYRGSIGSKGDVMVVDPAGSAFFNTMRQGAGKGAPSAP